MKGRAHSKQQTRTSKRQSQMGLVNGYSSDSSSDCESDSNDTPNLNKRTAGSKKDAKTLKKLRKGNDPWAKWNSSSEEEEVLSEEDPDDFHDQSTLSEFLAPVEEDDGEGATEEEFSTFYSNKYYQEGSVTKASVKGREFKKDTTKIKCFMPKKKIHTFKGHDGGTNDMKIIPKTGHIFLSGGNDKTIKLWDMYHDNSLLREFQSGDAKAIRRLDFHSNGRSFLSCSYARNVKLWDTETGQLIHKFQLPSPATAIKFNPKIEDEFLVGLNNSEIKQFDTREQQCSQTYNHHISSILDLEFFPDGSKFISSSEDKTIRLWKTGINITIKHISDTRQYAMPFIKIHPSNKVFLTQSMDNIIRTYEMKPKYKQQKKLFQGHHCAGHGIGFSMSPDGKYVTSGDSKGKLLIWDWNTSRIIKTFQVDSSKKPISTVAWAPQETSKVLCSGSMGKIFMYD